VSILAQWKVRVRQIKNETYALAGAARDPRVPWPARLFALLALGYVLSPIDLIPDFIPIIGYLDDLVLVPFFILIARRLIPSDVLAEHRERARARENDNHRGRTAAVVIVTIWIVAVLVVALLLWRRLR
jgi:uncharacterized membrane protein YkvA (DUF1232 family)